MKTLVVFLTVLLSLGTHRLLGADGSWAGEYSDKKFLNGSAVFRLTIEQAGSKIQVSFDAALNTGQGCTPEAQAAATASKDKLQFSFSDSMGNAGNGTITRSGDQLVVSLKPSKMRNPDCAKFYRDNIRLTRMKK